MKNGKIILGAAAFIVTAASTLAFTSKNSTTRHKMFGKTAAGHCTQSTCTTVSSGALHNGKCHAVANLSFTVAQGVSNTLWTSRTVNKGCTGATKSWTKTF
jgi:hypothetical protein